MLDELKLEDFQGSVGQRFRVDLETGPIELELLQSNPLGKGKNRPSFSLLFSGPSKPLLPQSTYVLSGGCLDEEGIFLVPVGRDEEGVLYEAVFT